MKEPMFQRRHMKEIAAVISEFGRNHCRDLHWQAIKVTMGDMLAEDNPRFNRGKFEEACEP